VDMHPWHLGAIKDYRHGMPWAGATMVKLQADTLPRSHPPLQVSLHSDEVRSWPACHEHSIGGRSERQWQC
jgi:hypothetical protein